MRTRGRGWLAAVGAVVLMAGCGHRQPAAPVGDTLEVLSADRWPRLTDHRDPGSLEAACAASINYLDGVPADRTFNFGPVERTAAELAGGVRRGCEIITGSRSAEERGALLKNEFLLLRSVGRDGNGEVFFTGYYEPVLEARREADPPFTHPIHETPLDLVTVDLSEFGIEAARGRLAGRVVDRRLVPYPDRDDIDFGDGLPADVGTLGYVDDPVDAFFLHVQGSGTLVFPDGEMVRAGYAGTNGRIYRSIGRLLIDDGLVSTGEMSMQAIRSYLEDHPEDLRRVLSFNPSYVFFRPLPAVGGPLGCYGEPVTGGRSIATDRRLFPAPVLAWIRTSVPTSAGADESLAGFVLNQDTGGSIRGPGRVDLFFGRGDEAGELAGRTRHLGELYFLIPKK